MARVLIAGCGYVGGLLGERLASRGDAVWALRRRTRGLPPALCPIEADVTVPSTLRALPGPLDHVIVCVAPDQGDDEGYRSVYVEGLSNLLDHLVMAPQGRVLFASSTAVYEQQGGVWVDESTPTLPRSFRGRRLLQAERLLRQRWPGSIAVRFGGIYGPGRTRLLEAVLRSEATYMVGEPVYTNRIHREDCVGVLKHLIDLPRPESLYLGVDNEPVSRAMLVQWLAEALDAPRPRAVDRASGGRGTSESNKRCSNARLLSTGYRFAIPSFREGYLPLVAQHTAKR